MKRIFYFDNIKGILIFFVVLGHTLNICSTHYGYSYDFFKLISFFMMPLFIFVTGIFAKKSHKTPLKRSMKLLIVYIITQLLVTFYYKYIICIIGNSKSIFEPRYTLWYLLTCSSLYLCEYIIRKIKFKTIFILSLLISLLVGFISQINNFLSISRTLAALPFFVIGYYSNEINVLEFVKKYKRVFNILTILITLWFLFNQNFFLFKDTYLKYSYYSYGNPVMNLFKRFLLYIIFFIFSACILNIISKKKTILSYFGRNTLIIYLIHGVLLKTLVKYNLFIFNPFLGTIFIYLIIFVISTLICWIMKINLHKNIIQI